MIAPPRDVPLADVFANPSPVFDPVSGLGDLIGAVLAGRPAWMADGLCAEYPAVSFFPGRGESLNPAKRICAKCLARDECREWAIEQGPELDGVWGGLSPRQRHEARTSGTLGDGFDDGFDDGPALELVGAFLEQWCLLDPTRSAPGCVLYDAFRAWVTEAGVRPTSKAAFGAGLAACGLESFHGNRGKHWRGVALAESGPVVEATGPPRRSTAA